MALVLWTMSGAVAYSQVGMRLRLSGAEGRGPPALTTLGDVPGTSHADLSRPRLHVVTGKGGTGKTTVAAALAVALARGGRRVLLAEVEGRQGLAPLFDVGELPYAERHLLSTPEGGEVLALSVEPKAALLEYLELFYRLGRAGKLLEKMGAVDFATTVAPGLRDVLLTGKVYEAVRRREAGVPVYDAVVLDAPPTGRVTRFLNVNEEVVGLAKVGPVRNQAGSIMSLLRSAQTAIHLVTVLEEMPVQETADGIAELEKVGLPVGAVVVNQVREPTLARRALNSAVKGRLDRDVVLAGIEAAGLGGRQPGSSAARSRMESLADALLAEAADHGVRVALEERGRKDLAALDKPLVELPAVAGGVDLGTLFDLADRLRAQGFDGEAGA